MTATAPPPLMPIDEALARVRAAAPAMPAEEVPLSAARGRILAAPIIARLNQPLTDRSAMDGYALRAADLKALPASFKVIAAAPAGGAAEVTIGPGEAARIFTGAVVPEGADTVIIQENTEPAGDGLVRILEAAPEGANIRRRGGDFTTGTVGLAPGEEITARDIMVAAGMNCPRLAVRRRPRVALIATGDELVEAGQEPRPHQTIASSLPALTAAVAAWGAEPVALGIAPDDTAVIAGRISAAIDQGADMIVTLGGASVGDHDLVHKALAQVGFSLDFWKVAMKPGKPMLFGSLGRVPVLGLPGNPVSSMVCALIFLRGAIAAALARAPDPNSDGLGLPREIAMLGGDLPQNGKRHDFLRARLTFTGDGPPTAWPLPVQDSAQTLNFADAECLIPRTPFAQASKAGELYPINPLMGLF